jgi:hypothetical protein
MGVRSSGNAEQEGRYQQSGNADTGMKASEAGKDAREERCATSSGRRVAAVRCDL